MISAPALHNLQMPLQEAEVFHHLRSLRLSQDHSVHEMCIH